MKAVSTDIAIFGAGLGASWLARVLHQKTLLKVDVFDTSASLATIPEDAPLLSVPVAPLEELKSVLEREILEGSTPSAVRAFDRGEFTTFVGFGERKPQALEEWDVYLSPEARSLQEPVYSLCQSLLESVPVEFHWKSELTRLEVSQGSITSAVVNGDWQVQAKAYVVFTNPQEALKLLPQNLVDARVRQKISKSSLWTSLGLQFSHRLGTGGTPGERTVLIGSGEKPFVGFGLFTEASPAEGKTGLLSPLSSQLLSRWLTLVLPEEGEEEETYASALREFKRLMARAYPKMLDALEFEKITVHPKSHGHASVKMEKDESVPGLKNLWLGHRGLCETPGLAGAVDRAGRIAGALVKRFESAGRDLPESGGTPRLLNL
jgi:hypothetical protein